MAGRKLPWPVLVFTLLSSWIGAGSLFAGGENAYRNGFAALWQPAGGWFGLIVIAMIAGRARRFAQFTVPDLLETRYNAAARVLRDDRHRDLVHHDHQLSVQGRRRHAPPDLSRSWTAPRACTSSPAFVITFTALAGMASVAYLDLIIGALVTVDRDHRGADAAAQRGRMGGGAAGAAAEPFHSARAVDVCDKAIGFLLPTMLLLIGNQGMYQKFFSARSERDAKLAVFGWIVGTLILETVDHHDRGDRQRANSIPTSRARLSR